MINDHGVHQNTYGIYSRYALQWAPPWLGPPGENCLQFVWDNLGVIWPDAISLDPVRSAPQTRELCE